MKANKNFGNEPYSPRYFTAVEFMRCSPPCDIENVSPKLLRMLDALRVECDFPLLVTSAFRSSAYDKSKGRSGVGMHTKGLAVDIACNDCRRRFLIIKNAIDLGFTGIGISATFIHLDIRTPISRIDGLTVPLIWTY